MLKLSKQVFIHGLVIITVLVIIQLLLDAFQSAFLLYMPPIGFAIFLVVMFGIQPIVIGVFNIIMLHRIYNCEGWQIGFWLTMRSPNLITKKQMSLIRSKIGAFHFRGIVSWHYVQ